jgi:THAP4-like, heme-binding beta-barrel domain
MALSELEIMIGKWHGKGSAELNSVKAADYDEETQYEFGKNKEIIFYVQKTWKTFHGKRIEVLHLESGFIRKTESGATHLSNSQGNGRVEVMELAKTVRTDDSLKLVFNSLLHGNDPRMLGTVREYTFGNEKMKYAMKMSTTMNKGLKGHLKAELERVPE